MTWNEAYTLENMPTLNDIGNFINNPLWDALCSFLKNTYGVHPRIEHSKCSMAPGWNVKYKKNNRSLCTIYPNSNYFTCLVIVRDEAQTEAELLITHCDPYVQNIYASTQSGCGSKWLMIDVTSEQILENVKTLIALRMNR